MLNTSTTADAVFVEPIRSQNSSCRPASSPEPLLYPRGAQVFAGSFHREALVRIVAGCVCFFQTLRDGRRQILDVLGPGQIFSAGQIFGAGSYATAPVRAVAMALTQLEEIDDEIDASGTADVFQRLLGRSRAHATLLGQKTVPEKMATALLDLATQFSSNGPDAGITFSFKLHLTRADLADWLGMTLETVSRCLNDFKRSGLIEFDRPSVITILKRDMLLSIASGRHAPDETEKPIRLSRP